VDGMSREDHMAADSRDEPWTWNSEAGRRLFDAERSAARLGMVRGFAPNWEHVRSFFAVKMEGGWGPGGWGPPEPDGWTWGMSAGERWAPAYAAMARRFCPKAELGWDEVKFIHQIIRRSGFWGPFFSGPGIALAREAPTDLSRIDFIFVHPDGLVVPCEVKIAGSSRDVHGQLLRYLAELSSSAIVADSVLSLARDFVGSFTDAVSRGIHGRQIAEFLDAHGTLAATLRCDGKTGVILDTEYDPSTLLSVDLINRQGFSVSAYELAFFCRDPADLGPGAPLESGLFRMDLRRYRGPVGGA
jgi:hypothetical protein